MQALNGFLAKAGGKDKLTALIQVRHLVANLPVGTSVWCLLQL